MCWLWRWTEAMIWSAVDALADGRRFRTINVLDVLSRECQAVAARPIFDAQDVSSTPSSNVVASPSASRATTIRSPPCSASTPSSPW